MGRLGAARGMALLGLEGRPVRVECAVSDGLPATRVVGLPDPAVREAADRVRTAVRSSGLRWPDGRQVLNLAPADVPKVGSGFDLPVALAVLAASGQAPQAAVDGVVAFAELGLDGSLRPVAGALSVATAVARTGGRALLTDPAGAVEAALVRGLRVIPAPDLRTALRVLRGDDPPPPTPLPRREPAQADGADLADVRGQPVARRALEIAAAGGHHLLFVGPPGCGKSMLARRLPGLLPALPVGAALEVAAIRSVAGRRRPDEPLSRRPPFRDPHHTISVAGLVGGGSGVARPGELSLAHRGVLFLDEILELPRSLLDALRQPLETGVVSLVRARASVRYPARVQLVGAANPCPCGRLGGDEGCRCRPDQIDRYRARLSGPLLDRLDLQVELRPVDRSMLLGAADGEPSGTVRRRVERARAFAAGRGGSATDGGLNRDADPGALRAGTEPAALRLLADAVETLGVTARGFDRTLRVARTVADLDGAVRVAARHVEEALAYRVARVLAAPA